MGKKGLDEFIGTLTKNEFIYYETGTNEFIQNTTPHIVWSAASMIGKEK